MSFSKYRVDEEYGYINRVKLKQVNILTDLVAEHILREEVERKEREPKSIDEIVEEIKEDIEIYKIEGIVEEGGIEIYGDELSVEHIELKLKDGSSEFIPCVDKVELESLLRRIGEEDILKEYVGW